VYLCRRAKQQVELRLAVPEPPEVDKHQLPRMRSAKNPRVEPRHGANRDNGPVWLLGRELRLGKNYSVHTALGKGRL
jgi:hypothetical protein